MLNYSKKFENTYKDPLDELGKSMIYRISLVFESNDEVEITCYDFAEHMTEPSGLDVAIANIEYLSWRDSFF